MPSNALKRRCFFLVHGMYLSIAAILKEFQTGSNQSDPLQGLCCSFFTATANLSSGGFFPRTAFERRGQSSRNDRRKHPVPVLHFCSVISYQMQLNRSVIGTRNLTRPQSLNTYPNLPTSACKRYQRTETTHALFLPVPYIL
jgi:hypothetical protein